MEKINRPPMSVVPSLAQHENTLKQYCDECKTGKRSWQSSGNFYMLIRSELSELTSGHCSFCDGYPLEETSKTTIEHYFPKSEYKEKTYLWENLFLCCDKCQSFSNSDNPFKYTLKMDDADYFFDKYFWFDPQSGFVNVLENLDHKQNEKAESFLKRYGINSSSQRLQSRKSKYKDLCIVLKTEERSREFEPYRFVFDSVVNVVKIKNNFKSKK